MIYQKQVLSLHPSIMFILLVCLPAYGKDMLKEGTRGQLGLRLKHK